MKHAKAKSASGKAKHVLLAVLILLLAAGAVYLAARVLSGRESGLKYESNAIVGATTDGAMTKEEMQAMADRGMITMSINATPTMSLSHPEEGVNWLIENPAEQSTKVIQVDVIRNDTGETIYTTGAIRPGTYITGTRPDVELEEGVYSCTAYFHSFDIDTEEPLGEAGSQITLYVQP